MNETVKRYAIDGDEHGCQTEREHPEGYWMKAADVDAMLAMQGKRIQELERFKSYVHRCVEEHGNYKP